MKEGTKPSNAKELKENNKENAKSTTGGTGPLPTERLKTVVRRLAPNLPEEVFWTSVEPWVSSETVSWRSFWPGKLAKRPTGENVFSRAYIAFKNVEALARFSREYDGHVFRDRAGNESYAVVEFAPYQKVPTEKRKPDSRNATIEKDEDYISFLESLKAPVNPEPVTMESLLAASQPPPPPKTTPLLEALKAEKSAAKDKDAILRNHAHYKEIITRKDDAKGAARGTDGKKAKSTTNTAAAASGGPATASAAGAGSGASGKAGVADKTAAGATQKANANAGQKAGGQSKSSGGPSNQKPPHGNAQKRSTEFASVPSAPPVAGGKKANKKAQAQAQTQTQGAPPAAAKPPKPPRPARQAPNTAPTSGTPTILPSGGTTNGDTSNDPASNSAEPSTIPTPAPRRTRPVIGLASRQFEAALSGVAGSERRPRRDLGKDKEAGRPTPSGTPTVSPGTETSAATTPVVDKEKGATQPPSPRKERGGRRGGGPPYVKVPAILQRSEVEGAQSNEVKGVASAPEGTSAIIGGTESTGVMRGGGSRRGRGRGRGGGATRGG